MKVSILLGGDCEGSTVIDVYLDRDKAEAARQAAEAFIATRPPMPDYALLAFSAIPTDEQMKRADEMDKQYDAVIAEWAAKASSPHWVWYDHFRILEKDIIV